MKKIMMLFVLLIVMMTSSVQALDWAISFVVWKGNVYEVKKEWIEEHRIGEVIGRVWTKPTKMSGRYFGNASNSFPKGTKYYEIKGISTTDAIAVEQGHRWVKAVYAHKAPFHILNVFFNRYFIFAVVMIALSMLGIYFRNRYSKQYGATR